MLRTSNANPTSIDLLAPLHDPLGVLTSTLPVMLASANVVIDCERIEQVASEWAQQPWPADEWDTALHYMDNDTNRVLNWLAVLDALNFCFWAPANAQRWQVYWQGAWHNGYAALAAVLTRAVKAGYPLWDAQFLRDIDATTLSTILHPDNDSDAHTAEIPLFAARLDHLHELGSVLVAQYHGQFREMVVAAQHSAVTLVQMITTELPSFNDVTAWNGSEVRLYKRAQILVGDIATACGNTDIGTFSDILELTAFADYKVPQLLRRLGILEYVPPLAAIVDGQQQLSAASVDEVAIRAATIWGVELVRRSLAVKGIAASAIAIDHRLWQAGQHMNAVDLPYHRTLTIYY